MVDIDVVCLLDLDVMEKFKILFDFGDEALISKSDQRSPIMVNEMAPTYMEWISSIFYTHQEPRKI